VHGAISVRRRRNGRRHPGGAGFVSRPSSGNRDAVELDQSGEAGCDIASASATAGIADLPNDARRWRARAGNVEMQERALVLAVNSRPRSDRGRLLLSEILGERVGQPSVETESVEQMLASRDADIPQQLDIPEEERCAILHDHLDRHYRDALDQPIPMLGDKSPRAAVRTASGRIKVASWLKMIENRTAKSADHDGAMANYSFDWLWTELGIDKLRR
jgi:hypothetical protein